MKKNAIFAVDQTKGYFVRQFPILTFLFLLLSACSPRLTVDIARQRPPIAENPSVYVIDGQERPQEAEYIGKIAGHGYFDPELAAVKEVLPAGGNVLSINYLHKPLFFSNELYYLEADILYVEHPEALYSAVKRLPIICPITKKHFELSLGISGEPLYAFEVAPLGVEAFPEGPYSATELYGNSYYGRTAGMFTLEAAWQFHKRWALVGSAGYSHVHLDYVDPSTDAVTRQESGDVFTLFGGIRYYYVSRPAFKSYGGLQMGLLFHTGDASFWKNSSLPDRKFSAQYTFWGMSFGSRMFCTLEFYGMGEYYITLMPGFGGKLGIGYRF